MGFSRQKARLRRLSRKGPPRLKERKPLGSLAGRGTFDLAPLVAFEMSSVLHTGSSIEDTWGSKESTKETISPSSDEKNDITPFPFYGYEKNSAINGGLEGEISEDDERDEKENLRRSSGNTQRCQAFTLNNIEPTDEADRNHFSIKKKRGRSALYELTSLIDDDSRSLSSVDNPLNLDEDEENLNGVKSHMVPCTQTKADNLSDQNEFGNVKKLESKDQWIRSTSTERSPESSHVKEQKAVNQTPKVATVAHPSEKISQCVCRTMENVEVAVLQVTKECDKVMHKLTGQKHEWLWD